jgi:hypothetical protein
MRVINDTFPIIGGHGAVIAFRTAVGVAVFALQLAETSDLQLQELGDVDRNQLITFRLREPISHLGQHCGPPVSVPWPTYTALINRSRREAASCQLIVPH